MDQIFYGFFESENSDPDYSPRRDAPCPFCGTEINADDVRTHSLIHNERSYAQRSYFYRTHRTCAEKYGSLSMDGFILDMIARNGD